MNLNPSTEHQPHDELPRPYRIAVASILAEPMPAVDPTNLLPMPLTRKPFERSRRRWLTQVYGMSFVGAAAILVIVSLFAIWPRDAWAQVANAVRKQSWVRLRAELPDKTGQMEIWLSPAKRIGAGRLPGASFFLELDERKLQRFDQKKNTIYVTEPQPTDLDGFVALDAVLEAFANGQELRQSKAEAVKLRGQSKLNGRSGDERWTEYVLDYEDARRSPPLFRRVFRVPEGAELPTRMTEEWTWEEKTMARTYTMDYPATGPADLFALDVPKGAKVVDTRSGEELKALLAAYSQQQKSAFDAYKATLLTTVQDWKSLNEAFNVRLDGSGHTAEVVDAEQLLKFQMDRIQAEGRIVPEDADRVRWWQVEVGKLAFKPFGQGDTFFPGQTYCPDLVGYPGLGIPNEGMRATLNPKPNIGPADAVMVTVEDTKSGAILGRYWLAPDRGLMCVRSEMPDKENGWIPTRIVDTAEKSPKGRWYATQVRSGRVERSGDDLRAEMGVAPVATSTYRYIVEFPQAGR